MGGVLVGFSIIGFVILIGYFVERFSIVGEGAGRVLNRMAFFVATPALLFTVLSHADVSVLFSEFLVVIVSTIVVGVLFYLVAARLFFRTPVAEAVLGASSATYVNANNIGLPVAIYVLGSAQYVAPVLLLQLVILAPTILAVLDITTRGRAPPKMRLPCTLPMKWWIMRSVTSKSEITPSCNGRTATMWAGASHR